MWCCGACGQVTTIWRERLSRGERGAYDGWRAVMATNLRQILGFQHIVEAGGGTLVALSPTALATATHVLCDPHAEGAGAIDVPALTALGIMVLHHSVISDVLLEAPTVAIERNLLMGSPHGGVTRSGGSRRSATSPRKRSGPLAPAGTTAISVTDAATAAPAAAAGATVTPAAAAVGIPDVPRKSAPSSLPSPPPAPKRPRGHRKT